MGGDLGLELSGHVGDPPRAFQRTGLDLRSEGRYKPWGRPLVIRPLSQVRAFDVVHARPGEQVHQPPQAGILSLRTDGCHHDGYGAAVRRSQQIEVCNAKRVRELQDPLGGSANAAVHALMGSR